MRRSRVPAAVLLAIIAGCSSDGDGGTNPGSISLSINPTSATIVQGGSQPVAATLTRAGGFTGTVAFTVTGQPAGVTASLSNVSTVGAVTSATVTIQVDAAVAPGVYNLVLHGTAVGVTEATANFTLTVDQLVAYALIVNNNPQIVQGGSGPANIVLVRANFTGNVTLALEGAPAGITGVFAPNPVALNASVLTISVAATVAPNTYNMTVRGTSSLTDRTTVFAVTVLAAGSFTLGITPAGGVTMVQGTVDASKTINITRTNYTLPITLTAENLPAGLTASFAGNPVAGNTSVLTLTATAGLAPDVYNITIRGTGPAALRLPGGDPVSVEATTTLAVTVTAAVVGNFTLTTTPSGSAGVTQGTSAQMTVNIVRTGGFAGGVTLSTTGLPAGLTFVYGPNPSTAASSTLQITAAVSLAPGAYPVVIHGNFTGLAEQTVNLTINIIAPGGNVTVSFATCAPAERPVWAAAQDGTFIAPWHVVTGVLDVYTFPVNAGRGGFTYVTLDGGDSQVNVWYKTQAEWTAGTIDFCGTTTPSGRTLTGTVAGMGSLDVAQVSFGGAATQAVAPAGTFTLNDAGTGARDLVIYSHPQAIVAFTDRMLIDRDENPATGFGTRNIQTDPFSFVPQAGLITITNPGGGESFTHSNTFHSRNTCDAAPLYFNMPVTGSSFYAYGVVSPNPTDRHAIGISGATGITRFRSVFEYTNTISSRSIAMGSQVPAGTTTESGLLAGYSILRNQYTAPADFNGSFTWQYVQASLPRSATVTATYGYFAGTSIDLKIGVYTGLAGWTPQWAPQVGFHADTYSTATGFVGSGDACSGLERFIVAGFVASF